MNGSKSRTKYGRWQNSTICARKSNNGWGRCESFIYLFFCWCWWTPLFARGIEWWNSKHWEKAMDSKFQPLQNNNTWLFIPLPFGCKPMSCKWIFKIKYNANGSMARHKVHLMAKIFTQVEGIDFKKTFFPFAQMKSIWDVLIVVAIEDFEVHRIDVEIIFLRNLLEEIYMQQLEGFVVKGKEKIIWKIFKSFYGLK